MYVRVRVTPDAKKEHVERVAPDSFEIAVRELALRNMANQKVRELVAAAYGADASVVRIVSGHRSRTKIMGLIYIVTQPLEFFGTYIHCNPVQYENLESLTTYLHCVVGFPCT